MKNYTLFPFMLLALFLPGTALPQNSPGRRALISYDDQLVQANILFERGELDEALAATKAPKNLDGKRFEAQATAALILHAAGEDAKAEATVDKALKLSQADKAAKVQNFAKLTGVPREVSPPQANTLSSSPHHTSLERRSVATVRQAADRPACGPERSFFQIVLRSGMTRPIAVRVKPSFEQRRELGFVTCT